MADTQTQQKKPEWPLKLLALVCALVLWFYAEAEENPQIEMQFDVPVQYVNQGEGYVVDAGAKSVRIVVKGKEVELNGLRSDDFSATVDLANAEVGTSEYNIAVTTPSRVERFSYQPMKTKLQIDKIQKKEVPVRVRTIGSLSDDLQLSSTEVIPNTVVLEGMSSQLNSVTDIETEAIDLATLQEETTIEAVLHIPENLTLAGEQTVQVHFVIQPEQHMVHANIALRHVPDGMTAVLQPTSADVAVHGTLKQLENMQEGNSIQLYVDCSGLAAGEYQLPVQIEYPGSLTVLRIVPDMAAVTVQQETQPDDQQTQDTNMEHEKSEGDLT